MNGRLAGGAIVAFGDDGRTGHLDFLFVGTGSQSKDTGQTIWHAIEALYPKVEAGRLAHPTSTSATSTSTSTR